MSFYRKYRPKDFPSLVGQEHIKVTLLNAIKAGQIAHAYLFTGPRGTGKTTTARLLAKAINAESMTEDGRFDGSEIAEEIDAGRLIDVIEIDAASNRGIDEIRDLREKINYSPTRAKNKVYIIDEVHMLTKEAFNALLKTLEEPPAFVYFILATTEINKVPETIISRCQRFDFRRITEGDLLARLLFVADSEGVKAEEEGLKIIAKQARGGLRDALTLFEQLIADKKLQTERVKAVLGISNFAACEELYGLIESGSTAQGMAKLDQIFQAGVDLVQFNRDFLDFLRQRMLEAVRNSENNQAKRLIVLLGFFQEAYEKQKFSYIPELPLEIAIAKSCLGNIQLSYQEISPREHLKIAVKPTESPMKDLPLEQDEGSKKKSELDQKAGIGSDQTTNQKEIKTDWSFETFMTKWESVFGRIQNPLAKRCLRSGKPVGLEGASLVLAFASNFNKDKLFVPDLLAVCEEAIKETYGTTIKLSGKVDPSLATISAPINQNDEIAMLPKKDNLAESALNVFGGEIVG